MNDSRRPRTVAVHGPDPAPGPSSTPLVHSSTFSAPSLEAMMSEQDRGAAGSFYQRYGHPTVHAVERRLAALDGSEGALLFPSGMAAITATLLGHLRAGDHVVALRQAYGGTLEALRWGEERLGWSHTLVDARMPDSWDSAFRANTRILHVESPTNPTLAIVDLAAAAALAHRHGARLTVDNTFASPVGQHPLALGADLVVYSATKSIGGHADLLGGIVSGPRAALDPVGEVRKRLMAPCDPTTAWLIERSLKTLPLRVAAANESALELARRLGRQAAVRRVHYPGLPEHPGHAVAARQMTLGSGPVLAFEVEGADRAREVAEALRVFRHAPSLGGVDSLVSLPAHTSHKMLGPERRAESGIAEGLVRLSVGIEDVEDLWTDLENALARVPAATR